MSSVERRVDRYCGDSNSDRQQWNQEVRDKYRNSESDTDTMQAIKGFFITLITCAIGSGNQYATNKGQQDRSSSDGDLPQRGFTAKQHRTERANTKGSDDEKKLWEKRTDQLPGRFLVQRLEERRRKNGRLKKNYTYDNSGKIQAHSYIQFGK